MIKLVRIENAGHPSITIFSLNLFSGFDRPNPNGARSNAKKQFGVQFFSRIFFFH